MRDNREKFAELGELLGVLRDGTIGAEQMESLDRLLAADADAREYYLEYMNLCATLGHFQGTLANVGWAESSRPTMSLPVGLEDSAHPTLAPGKLERPPPRSSRTRRRLLTLAAAVVLFGIGLSMFYFARPVGLEPDDKSTKGNVTEAVAVLTRAVQPQWEGETPAIGSKLWARQRLRLRSGVVQLEFFSGAVLVVEGPADFEPLEVGRVYCREGRMRARVSPPAEGFTIASPAVELVDRGTEFGFRLDPAGRAEVHVFHGKVELHNTADNSLRADSPHLTTGNGVSIDASGVLRKIAADPKAFISAAKLEQEWRQELRGRHAKWLAHAQKLRADSRLMLYYTFQDHQPGERTLPNQALARKGTLNGAIIGCEWSEGRWPGKGALDFKRPSDRVRVQVPGEYQSLTFLAWLRVDAFDQYFSALMLTDGWDEGAPHWQLTNEGRVLLGIKGRGAWGHDYYSQPCLTPDKLGKWLQLATVYDRHSRTVTHYVDGRAIRWEGLRFDIPLRIGNVEIGNWGRVVPNSQQQMVIRNFNGHIDEFALFREALSPEEIARLHEFGRACP